MAESYYLGRYGTSVEAYRHVLTGCRYGLPSPIATSYNPLESEESVELIG